MWKVVFEITMIFLTGVSTDGAVAFSVSLEESMAMLAVVEGLLTDVGEVREPLLDCFLMASWIC